MVRDRCVPAMLVAWSTPCAPTERELTRNGRSTSSSWRIMRWKQKETVRRSSATWNRADAGELLLKVPLHLRVIDALRGGPLTDKELAESCHESEGEIRACRNRELRGKVQAVDKRDGLTTWGLLDTRHQEDT